MTTVLVATDFSEASRKALDVALTLVPKAGDKLVLVHALLAPSSHRTEYGSDPIGLLEQDIGRDEAMTFHEDWATPLRALGHDVKTVVEEGHRADVILQGAEDHDADFIVVGKQGWGRLERLRIGSVSRKVSELSKRPVVIVPYRKD